MGKHTNIQNMFVADFETCDNVEVEPEGLYEVAGKQYDLYPQKVWFAGIQNIATKHIEYFTNIESFMVYITSKTFHKNKLKLEIAFHNLRFDGTYIVPWLLKNNYFHIHGTPKKNKDFSILVDERNAWYSITIKCQDKAIIKIWDSVKLFPIPLRELPDLYHTPTKKIEENEEFYNKIRKYNHEPTLEEIKYLNNDLNVLSETIEEHLKVYGEGFKKTQASQSFTNFKQDFRFYKMRFPGLSDQQDEMCRQAYYGGISYVNPKHQYKDLENLASYDIISSYPYQLATKPLPYGKPLFGRGAGKEPDYSKFFIGVVSMKFKLKENKIPCIPKKALCEGDYPIEPLDFGDKWLNQSAGYVYIAISSIDLKLIKECYDFEIYEWLWTLHFKTKVQKEIRDFILYNFNIKQECSRKIDELKNSKVKDLDLINELKSKKQRAKININSFYGKFGEEILKYNRTPYLEENRAMYKLDHSTLKNIHQRNYLPVAIATTSYARTQLVQFANTLGEHFVYCDTDSIHYLREGEYKLKNSTHTFSDTELGAWEFEDNYIYGKYLRSKCYMEINEKGDQMVTLAGLPADPGERSGSKKRSLVTKENFHIGHEYIGGNGKLRVIQTSTGAKLVPTNFKINKKLGFN